MAVKGLKVYCNMAVCGMTTHLLILAITGEYILYTYILKVCLF